MTVLLRALGLQAAYAVLRAMSPAAARVATVALLLTVNAVPLVALLDGEWGAGDVLIAYWLENVAVGAWTMVKIATAGGPDPVTGKPGDPRGLLESGQVTVLADGSRVQFPPLPARLLVLVFFTMHYGMFTLVHGVFTFTLARRSGTTGSLGSFSLMFLALLLSHGISTGIHWFARGERLRTGITTAMGQPYGRILVMHVAVLGSGFLLFRGSGPDLSTIWPPAATLGPGLLLIALKVVVDVFTHLQSHREAAVPAPARIPA